MGRKGNAYVKQGMFDEARQFYQKAARYVCSIRIQESPCEWVWISMSSMVCLETVRDKTDNAAY